MTEDNVSEKIVDLTQFMRILLLFMWAIPVICLIAMYLLPILDTIVPNWKTYENTLLGDCVLVLIGMLTAEVLFWIDGKIWSETA